MNKSEKLFPGKFYHVFNRGIDGCDIFRDTANFEYFFDLYLKYIDPVAETFAWVLMKNHFHFLVRIKETTDGGEGVTGVTQTIVSRAFSNLFNAYTKAFNKRYKRTGSLFEKNFHRKRIDHPHHLRNVLLYIHYNPVHHGFCNHPSDYPWSSYLTCISFKPTHLNREKVIGWFDSLGNFKTVHNQTPDLQII
jgi:putative transposase